jgi:hypothetical protein
MWNKVNGVVCVIAKYSAYLHICQLENVKGFLGAFRVYSSTIHVSLKAKNTHEAVP